MIRTTVVPDKSNTKISFTFPENYIGEEVEIIAFTKKEGMPEVKQNLMLSPALSGDPLTDTDFKNWITQAEAMPSISLDKAKSRWANKRSQLQKLIK